MKLIFIARRLVVCSVFIFVYSQAFSNSYYVDNAEGFTGVLKIAEVDDSIIWKTGSYNNLNLKIANDKLVFLAEVPGETIFSGSSELKIEGDGNIISGFQFIGGKIEGDVIDISGNHNRIEHINVKSYDAHYYLRVRPNCQHNTISFCNFEAKPETQESSVVQIEATEDLPGYHVVSYCSFKNHTAPPDAGGDFGIEALRIGYSYQRTFISRTIVEYCYFEKCNGDHEVISNKACENVLRYNTFFDNGPAHLTLRHGSRAMVYGNFFINGAGVRIKEGQNHTVANNYFDTNDYFSLHLQNHHFDPVDTVKITNNTFITYSSIMLGGAGEFQPNNVVFANNLFSPHIKAVFDDETGHETWINNVLAEADGQVEIEGTGSMQLDFSKNGNGLSVPEFSAGGLKKYKSVAVDIFDIPMLNDDFMIALDIMKHERTEKNYDVPGCFIPDGHEVLKYHATKQNTGPIYLR